ncbi:MAG: amidohydrolase family protein [Clostridia bacterium]|nr:amidohydrolase family protein [Clostridia bacterium]
MPIDFHTHVFPDQIAQKAICKLQAASHTRPFTDGTARGLAASMKRAGIGLSVVLPVATSARQVPGINDAAKRMNERAGVTGILSFGGMHPDLEGWEAEMERIRELGLPGVKLHPPYQHVDADDERVVRIVKKAGELGLMVITHAGLDVGLPGNRCSTPEKLRRLSERAPDTVLILAHMGGWRCWKEAEALLRDTGVYLDTSFSLGSMTESGDGYYQTPEELRLLEEEGFLRLVDRFGAHRILFGTDSPWGDQEAAVSLFEALALPEEDKQAIFSLNAQKLLNR